MYYLHTGVERTCRARTRTRCRAPILIALEMMALTGGKERTEQEFATLLRRRIDSGAGHAHERQLLRCGRSDARLKAQWRMVSRSDKKDSHAESRLL